MDNTGNREAKGVVCAVTVPGARIEKHKVKHPASMRNTEELRGDTLVERFDGINPSDPIQISIQAVGSSPLPPRPLIDCRAEGVVGTERGAGSSQSPSGVGFGWFSGIISIIVVSLGFSIMSLYGFVEKSIKNYTSLVEVEIKIPDESSISVKALRGLLVPKGWVKLVQFEHHGPSGHSYDDLRKLGTGKHIIQRK